MSYDPTDPRLTAYALDEMPGEERPAFESGLDAADRAEIAALREVAALLREGLAEEPMPSLTEAQREAIHQRAAPPARRRFRWVVWLAAAAGLAVLAALVRPGPRSTPVLATRLLDKDDARVDRVIVAELEKLAPSPEGAPAQPTKAEEILDTLHLPEQTLPARAKRVETVAETHLRPSSAPSPLDGSLAAKAEAAPPAPQASPRRAEAPAFAAAEDLAMNRKAAEAPQAPAMPAPTAQTADRRRAAPAEAGRNVAAPQKAPTPEFIGGMGAMGDMDGGFGGGEMAMALAGDNPFLTVRAEPVARFRVAAVPAVDIARSTDFRAMPRSASLGRLGASVEVAPCPWTPAHWLARLTLRGRNLGGAEVQVDWRSLRISAYRLVGQDGQVLIQQGTEGSVLYELIPEAAELGRTVADRAALLPHRLDIVLAPRTGLDESERLLLIANIEQVGELDGDFAYAAAVAAYTMVRSGSPLKGTANLELVEKLARAGIGREVAGPRHEFLKQVRRAREAER